MNILIQGGGRGIGAALARRALAEGTDRLFITARDPGNSHPMPNWCPTGA